MDAFHSRLFVDDCDLNVKIKALQEIQELFKSEKSDLMQMFDQDKEKYDGIKNKFQSVINLSNTMDSFISNLIQEIDESRAQMFGILENIACYEATQGTIDISKNNHKQKIKNKRKNMKKMQKSTFNFKPRTKSESVMKPRTEKVIDHTDQISDDLDFGFDPDEGQSQISSQQIDSPRGSVSSKSSFIIYDESQLIDDEEVDEFEDAQGDVELTDEQQMQNAKEIVILDCD